MEFGGKCTDYTTCVYPDKAAGTCIEKKVDFRPRDCPSLSAAAGGKHFCRCPSRVPVMPWA